MLQIPNWPLELDTGNNGNNLTPMILIVSLTHDGNGALAAFRMNRCLFTVRAMRGKETTAIDCHRQHS